MDQGAWDLRLALLPHRQALAKDELFRKADEFMLPPVLLGDSLHEGFLQSGAQARLTNANRIRACSCLPLSARLMAGA